MLKGLPAVEPTRSRAAARSSTRRPAPCTWRHSSGRGSRPRPSPGAAEDVHRHPRLRHLDAGETSYVASGRVPGYLLNQFAMSEYRGVLRGEHRDTQPGGAATRATRGKAPSGPRSSAPARRRAARAGVRSRQGRAHLCRALHRRQRLRGHVPSGRSPLHHRPRRSPRPEGMGEAQDPRGYSAYLHPLRNNRILGIGQDASEEGRLASVPALAVRHLRPASAQAAPPKDLGLGTSSEAEYQHHAFLYWRPTSAVLQFQGQSFTGAVGVHVSSADGLNEVGRACTRLLRGLRRADTARARRGGQALHALGRGPRAKLPAKPGRGSLSTTAATPLTRSAGLGGRVDSELFKQITIPVFTGVIGYVTNWSGVWMLFHPIRFRGFRCPAWRARRSSCRASSSRSRGSCTAASAGRGSSPRARRRWARSRSTRGSRSSARRATSTSSSTPSRSPSTSSRRRAGDIRDVVERIMEREHPQLWHDLPPRVREAVHARVQRAAAGDRRRRRHRRDRRQHRPAARRRS